MRLRRPHAPIQPQGFTIVEALLGAVLISTVMAATAQVMAVINRQTNLAKQQIALQESINAHVGQLRTLARTYTCCSGQCVATIPASTKVGGDTESIDPANEVQPCATRDWRDDRYYFPQRDLPSTTTAFPNTTTSSEPLAVDQLCASNTNFMTPFQTAANTISITRLSSAGGSRSTHILDNKTLRITYTDTINNTTAHTLYIRPTAADFCN